MAKKIKTTDTGQAKNRTILIILIMVVVLLAVVMTLPYLPKGDDQPGRDPWALDESDLLSIRHRTLPAVQVSLIEDTSDYTLEKISYQSYDTKVYGLLRTPKEVQRPPVVIVLPAATVTKEGDVAMANALASFGYASLTLDERGNGGETLGISPMDLTSGYTAYRGGEMPAQYAQIYDVLLAYDYLRSRQDLDGTTIAVLGESMGGRFAIITAALEPGLKGAFVISSGPYGVDVGNKPDVQHFVTSIEPASYLQKIPPRTLVMFHFTGDPIISLEDGLSLFEAAGQPKVWYQYNGTVHGIYSDVYADDLHNELKSVFGR